MGGPPVLHEEDLHVTPARATRRANRSPATHHLPLVHHLTTVGDRPQESLCTPLRKVAARPSPKGCDCPVLARGGSSAAMAVMLQWGKEGLRTRLQGSGGGRCAVAGFFLLQRRWIWWRVVLPVFVSGPREFRAIDPPPRWADLVPMRPDLHVSTVLQPFHVTRGCLPAGGLSGFGYVRGGSSVTTTRVACRLATATRRRGVGCVCAAVRSCSEQKPW
jgi:hypothetical protein